MQSHVVPKLEKEVRLSDYAIGIFSSIQSRKGIKKAIEKKLVQVDGQTGYTFTYLKGGEKLDLLKPKMKKRPNINLDLEVLWEDEFLAIINKPAGIVVSGNMKRTIENGLRKSLSPSHLEDALDYPEPIHRLDFPTSGALLIGKTKSAVVALNKLFENKAIKKTYLAITQGASKTRGTIKTDIKTKHALTKWKRLQTIESTKFDALNLIEVYPETGRRHQIRIHLAERKTPILGDAQYGIEGKILKSKGLFLHAKSLEFIHPFTNKKLNVVAPTPNKFKKIFAEL